MRQRNHPLRTMLAAVLALALSGCGASPAASDPGTVPETTTPQTDAPQTEGGDAPAPASEGDAAAAYADVLERYRTALTERWDETALDEQGMSHALVEFYDRDGLGFALLDLDNDGNEELLIGVNDAAGEDKTVFDGYTCKDGTVTQIFSGAYRNAYFIQQDEAAGYLIANEASNSAANNAWITSILLGTELSVVQSIVYDAGAKEGGPWFMGSDDDWDTSNDAPIDEALALSIMESGRNGYIRPDYTAF